MRNALLILIAAASLQPAMSIAQAGQRKPASPVSLDISVEVATTTNSGQPSAVRITLKNIGTITADLPMPQLGCECEDGSLTMKYEWHSIDPNDHSGRGSVCVGGLTDQSPLMVRASREWIRLQPGEFLTVTENLKTVLQHLDPGTVEFWWLYTPPRLTSAELIELQRSGYTVPTDVVSTPKQTISLD